MARALRDVFHLLDCTHPITPNAFFVSKFGGKLVKGWAVYQGKKGRHFWVEKDGKKIDVSHVSQYPASLQLESDAETVDEGKDLDPEWEAYTKDPEAYLEKNRAPLREFADMLKSL